MRGMIESGMVILGALIVATAAGSALSSPKAVSTSDSSSSSAVAINDDLVYWEEEIPEEPQLVEQPSPTKTERKLLWSKDDNVYDAYFDEVSSRPQSKSKKNKKKPHPLRTNEWKLNLYVGKRHAALIQNSLFLEFSTNGYVRALASSSEVSQVTNAEPAASAAIGKWKLLPSGISWNIPIHLNSNSEDEDDGNELTATTVLHYHADLHLNQFGQRPKMTRGIVTRDRYPTSPLPKTWFRPVIATFSAEGIGKDTADVSYQERGFGLAQPS